MMLRKSIVICVIFFNYCEYVSGLQLEKVLVLSRHSIRAPLSHSLETFTSKVWPQWSVETEHLTPKGALLEGYMGEYFSAWLHELGLFLSRCPEDSLYVYSNNRQRTIGTAKAFFESAFPNCSINVNVKNVTYPNLRFDPVFDNIITNEKLVLKQSITRQVKENLEKVNLEDVYTELNNISDIEHSETCEKEGFCDLTENKDQISYNFGEYLLISGRYQIASGLVDAFVMEFYEGFPLENVGWGEITKEDQWKRLLKIKNEEMNVCLNTTMIRQFVKPLLEYVKLSVKGDRLLTLMVGHDWNLRSLMYALDFEPYELPDQFEEVPIGSKLVFQKWTDGENKYLKVEFVYQSWTQIRNGERLSLSNPPKNITMHFSKYKADKNGMYPWSYFESILDNIF